LYIDVYHLHSSIYLKIDTMINLKEVGEK